MTEVEYEVLDSIHDMKKGLEDVDEPIHWRISRGFNNVQKSIQEFGDRSMVENPNAMYHGKWKYMGVNHGFTEPVQLLHTGIQTEGCNFLASSTLCSQGACNVLDVPMHQVNVIRTFVGGGFGGNPTFHEMCAAILTSRPVRITFDMKKYSANRGRHPSHIKYRCMLMKKQNLRIDDASMEVDSHHSDVTSYYNEVLQRRHMNGFFPLHWR